MSVFDVTVSEEEVTEIKWSESESDDYNLIPSKPGEVTINDSGLNDLLNGGENLIVSVGEAENLIKAIQKAIDLGWFNK